MLVKPFDFHGIIEKIGTDVFVVRKKFRYSYIFGQFPGFQPRLLLIATVWFTGAIPETERLFRIAVADEIVEVGRVVRITYLAKRWVIFLLIIFLAGRILRPAGIGVDTWGVDFALLDRDDNLLGNPVHYRDDRTEGMMEAVFAKVPRDQLFARTGIQFMRINTLYQMMSMT